MKNVFEEKLLLYKIQTEKDPDAFAALYDRYIGPIYRFVYFKLSHKQEAEDVAADIFLKCWQYLANNTGKEVRSFSALLYTIARNQVVEVYRARARKPERIIQDEDDMGDKGRAKEALDARYESHRLFTVIKKLKQEYQEVVLFRYIEGFSIGEIAAMTGKSQTNVRVTLHRALKKLKELTGDFAV
jgi:RNA polymerase sigma-70 factor (ECF subfamily)